MSTGTNKERIEQNNLKLEDIKTQIQNLPEAGGTVEGVKQFSTIEEMQADTTAKEGDLAVVYRSEIQNTTVDSRFQVATFPDTVVLDTAVTGSIDLTYKAVDSSVTFDCGGSLGSSSFRMDCYIDNGSIRMKRINYTSSDGITYTRTDNNGNPVDFGTEICYAHPERWNDVIGKFIQIGGSTFEGLFKYSDGSWVLAHTQLTATADYVCEKEFYGKNGVETGTMPDNGALTYIPSEQEQAIPAGYTSGGTVKAADITTLSDYKSCDALATNILGSSKPYTELEYIQSSGTQYIDTGIMFDVTNCKIIMDFQYVTPSVNTWFCGVNMLFEGGIDSDTAVFYTGAGFTYSENNTSKRVTATGINTTVLSANTYMFARNWPGEYGPASIKLYSAQVYKNDVLVRDFIPIKDLVGIACLYDKISATNFYNVGSGNFIAGGVV